MSFSLKSLRVIVPTSVMLAISLFAVIIAFYQYRLHTEQVVRMAEQDIRDIMLQSQRRIEQDLTSGNDDMARQELLGLGVLDAVDIALVLDAKGSILFSTENSLIGSSAGNHIPHFNQAQLDEVIATFLPLMHPLSSDKMQVYYPLVIAVEKGRIRPTKLGGIYIEWNLRKGMNDAQKLILNSLSLLILASVFVVVMLVAINRRLIITPIARLQEQANALGAGHYENELSVSGVEEIAALEASFNAMGHKIKDSLSALTNSEERWLFALEGSGDGVADWSLQNDIVFYSAKLRRILGYEDVDYNGSYEEWKTLIHKDDRENARRKLSRHLHGDTELYQTEYRIRTAQGNYKWMLVRGKVVEKDRDGLPLRFVATFMDVTSRRATEEALRSSEKKYRKLFELAQEGIWVIDECSYTTMVNKSMLTMLGYEEDEMIGKHLFEFMDDQGRELCEENLRRRHAGVAEAHDFEFITKSGERIYTSLHTAPITDDEGIYRGAIAGVINITARVQAEETVRRQARYDDLTGLPNRNLLFERLEEELARAHRHQYCGAVLFVDLDHFKNINDSLGHPIGDQLLVGISQRIRELVRKEDVLARLGGDEFVVLLPELDRHESAVAEEAQLVAQKIQGALALPFYVESHQLLISCSIGIALYPKDDSTLHDIFRQADAAMYRSKQDGRNAIRFFSKDMQDTAEKRMRLQMLLPQALEQQEFKLVYQPQVDNAGRLIGAEALIRWHQPELGLISPLDFISIAEESGMIVPIGDWVMQEACRQMKFWIELGLPADFRRIAVNISPRQFAMEDFSSRIQSIVQGEGIEPNRIEMEITEGVLLSDLDMAVEKMNLLRSKGFYLSIDDFGTGYSSLSYLKSLPLSKLKIDQSFTRDITEDRNDRAIVETIISMARHLELDVLAEGVETEAQLEFLSNKGCFKYQGWYFGKPVSPDEFYDRWVKPINMGKTGTSDARPQK